MFALQILNLCCTAQTTIEYAQPGEQVSFQKYNSLYQQPYVCFTDFESLNKKLPVDNQTSQQVVTQHAFAYKYIIVNIIDNERPSITKEKKTYKIIKKVNLLLLNEDQVCLIKDLKKYYRAFVHRNKPINEICSRCLTIFENNVDCNNHTINCTAQTTIEYTQLGKQVRLFLKII